MSGERNGHVKVDLSHSGIDTLRRNFSSSVVNPRNFFTTQVQWLEKPVTIKILTLAGERSHQVLGIVPSENGKDSGDGCMAIDPMSLDGAKLPIIITRKALQRPLAWYNLVQAKKKTTPQPEA